MDISIHSSTSIGDNDVDMFETTGDSNCEYDSDDSDELEDLPSFVANNEDDDWDELDTGIDAEDLSQEDFEQQLAMNAISSSGTGVESESAPTATTSQCCHNIVFH